MGLAGVGESGSRKVQTTVIEQQQSNLKNIKIKFKKKEIFLSFLGKLV